MKRFAYLALLSAMGMTVLAGCDKSQSDKAGTDANNAAQKTGDAAQSTGDAMKNAADKTGDALQMGISKTNDGLKSAANATGNATGNTTGDARADARRDLPPCPAHRLAAVCLGRRGGQAARC